MLEIIKKFPEEVVLKAQNVRAIVVKVEGVLTTSKVLFSKGSSFYAFNLLDDTIVKPLRENGIVLIAITHQELIVFKNKIGELSYDCYKSLAQKDIKFLNEISTEFDVLPEEICFIGYDLVDLPYLKRAGLSICMNDSVDYIKSNVDFVSDLRGGEGAFREIADLILASQNKLEKIVATFLQK